MENDKLVWVKEGERYVLKVEGPDGYVHNATYQTLPRLPKEEYTIDDLQTFKIHYELIGNYLVIYDPSVVEWVDYTAPFRRVDTSKNVGHIIEKTPQDPETITSKVPSKKMLVAAMIYYEAAIKKINNYWRNRLKESFNSTFKILSNDGISFLWSPERDVMSEIQVLKDDYFFFEVLGDSEYISWLVIRKQAIKDTIL